MRDPAADGESAVGEEPAVPPVLRFAMVATVVFGIVALMGVGILLWIMATTGAPITVTPHRYGEAWPEAALLAILMGLGCYGTAGLDYVNRRR